MDSNDIKERQLQSRHWVASQHAALMHLLVCSSCRAGPQLRLQLWSLPLRLCYSF